MIDAPRNALSLGLRSFYLDVMHNPDLPLPTRIDAAITLLQLFGEEDFREPQFTVRLDDNPAIAHTNGQSHTPRPGDEPLPEITGEIRITLQ
jgi:hypothetical protein